MIDLTELLATSNEIRIPFGKYANWILAEVAASDPSYLDWMLRSSTSRFVERHRQDIIQALASAATRKAGETLAEVELTASQQSAVDQLIDMMGGGDHIVRLEGGAGYGKSFATRGLLARMIQDLGVRSIKGMAVSYVATEVLREQLDTVGAQTGTVAKMLAFEKRTNEQTGEDEYVWSVDTEPTARGLVAPGQVLVVDECSMINDRDSNLLFQAVRWALDHYGEETGYLVLVGDSHQLPPVKQDARSLCCQPWATGVAMLTEPMRYDIESDLYRIEQGMRHRPNQTVMELRYSTWGMDVRPVKTKQLLIDEFIRNKTEDPTALHRMLLFRRAEVINANTAIRASLFGPEADVVVDDEQLMIVATTDFPHITPQRKKELSREDLRDLTTRYYSGQTYRAASVETDEYVIDIPDGPTTETTHRIQHHTAELFHTDGLGPSAPTRLVFGMSENAVDTNKLGGPEYRAALNDAAKFARACIDGDLDHRDYDLNGPWDLYKKLKEDFIMVAYTYATTVHRSQGQTVDYAYCVPGPLLQVGGVMGQALAYVATTRARKRLTVVV